MLFKQPPPSLPDRAPSRTIAVWSLVVLALTAAAGIAVAEAQGWPFLRDPLQRALHRVAGVSVTFGGPQDRFVLKLFGRPRLHVGVMTVGAAPGPPAPYLLQGEDLRLDGHWTDVWRGWRGSTPWRVENLQARRLDLNLLRDASGRATWHIGRRTQGSAGADDWPRIGRLAVERGRIAIDDQLLASRLLITVQGSESDDDANRNSAGWRARVEGQWKALPLRLNVVTGSAMPLVADTDAADIALRVDGQAGAARLAFEGHAGALLGARRLEGALNFSGPSLDRVGAPLGVTLPQTQPFELEGRIAHDAGAWQLSARRASIGNSRLAGEFHFDTRPATPMLSGRLTGARLALADLGPAVGAGRAQPQPAGRVLPQRQFDLPSLRAMDADVQVAIDMLDFGTDAMAPLRSMTGRVLLAGGRLELQQMKALVAGGSFSGNTSYDSRTTPATWAARVRLAGVDIAGWLRGTRTAQPTGAPSTGPTPTRELERQRRQARQGGKQVVRNYVTGALEAALDVRGSGRSSSEILAALNGRIDLILRDGTLSHLATEAAGLDLAQALGVLLRGDRPLAMRCARLQATARDGIVRTDRAVIDNTDSTLLLAGEVNLRDESLALVARARPKDFSPLSLRTPITVRGTLARPVIGIEGGQLARKVGAAAVLGATLGPLAALLPLLDTGKDEGDACAPAPAQGVAVPR
jgi:AsmA family protein